MFIKLMKYELKSLGKSLLPLYGAVLAVAFINSVLWSLELGANALDGWPQATAMMVYVGLCVAIGVVTLMVILQRFYKGLLGQEGYLMFTLPVPTWQLTLSKLASATIMTLLSGVVGMLSVFVLASMEISWGTFLYDLMRMISAMFPYTIFGVEFILLMIFTIASGIAQLHICMAMGHLSHKHRVAMSFVWYIVITTVLTLVSGIFLNVFGASGLDYQLAILLANGSPEMTLHISMLSMSVFMLVKCAIFYAVTTWILEKKLNLE